jgi:riboflavin synthase
MFTGIIETTGIVKEAITNGSNKTFWIQSGISQELSIDQSVSHNGVCLTVEEIKDGLHRVTAIDETLAKTNVSTWQPGTMINIERCLQMNGRLDGHIVQGHTDTTGVCTNIIEKDGSWEYNFEMDKKFASLIIEKGSVAVNGISLTIFNVLDNGFTVAIIPYTYQHTNMQYLTISDKANIEFDMIGKYVNRMVQLK